MFGDMHNHTNRRDRQTESQLLLDVLSSLRKLQEKLTIKRGKAEADRMLETAIILRDEARIRSLLRQTHEFWLSAKPVSKEFSLGSCKFTW